MLLRPANAELGSWSMSQRTNDRVQLMRFRPIPTVVAVLTLLLVGWGGRSAYRQARAWYHLRAANAANERQDYAGAREHWQAYLDGNEASPPIYLEAARAARHVGAFDESERWLYQCAARRGDAVDVNLERILLEIARKTPTLDVRVVLQYVRNAPKDRVAVQEILESLSRDCLASYRLHDARAALTLWIEQAPADARPLLLRGWVLEQLARNPKPAVPDYQRAVELEPDNRSARLRLAEALVKSRQAAEALPHLEQLQLHEPRNPLVLLNLALCRQDLGDPPEARRLLDDLLRPETLVQVEELSVRLRGGRTPQQAVEEADWYRQAMALAPYGSGDQPHYAADAFIQALVERARLATAGERDGEALLRRAVQLDPFDYGANYQLSICLERHGLEPEAQRCRARLDEIRADQKRMSELVDEVGRNPHAPGPRCSAAEILLRHGQPQEAKRWLTSALQQDPNHAGARKLLAQYTEPMQNAGGADAGADKGSR